MPLQTPPQTAALLEWYGRTRRDLPWRAGPGVASDPYRVWLSEIMLQQTGVKAVEPYFEKFTARWPDVAALAAAPLDDILKQWAGLGYYARARNLHACARMVAGEMGGRFPDTEQELRRLPGIGPYTAAAIAAIAFGRQCVPVDGNVERVTIRYHNIATPLPEAKKRVGGLAAEFLPCAAPGDLAQALMDLGATVCTPTNPQCDVCPLTGACRARAAGTAAELPRRQRRGKRPVRRASAFWVQSADGSVLLRRRPASGLLGGMMEVPSSAWREVAVHPDTPPDPLLPAQWSRLPGLVRHVFTHFELEAEVWAAELAEEERPPPPADCRWVPVDELAGEALPSVMRKIVRHALARSER